MNHLTGFTLGIKPRGTRPALSVDELVEESIEMIAELPGVLQADPFIQVAEDRIPLHPERFEDIESMLVRYRQEGFVGARSRHCFVSYGINNDTIESIGF